MALLGTLLRNRHPDERNYAWSQTNLTAPGTLAITSRDFTDAALSHYGTLAGASEARTSPRTWPGASRRPGPLSSCS